MNRDLFDSMAMDTLEAMLNTRTVDELAARFHEAVSLIGDFYCVAGIIKKFQPGGLRPTTSSYPTSWTRHYMGSEYGRVDPVLRRAMTSATGFGWHACDPVKQQEKALVTDMHDFGIHVGFIIPIHGPDGSVFLVNFGQLARKMVSPRMQVALTMLAMQCYQQYHRLTTAPEPQPPALTQRECECLSWVANGRTTVEVADRLMLNENTVKFHLKNAQRKLDCTNRVTTVLKAISLGLIVI
ncbi:N-acylhomoserine lactone-dependent regulatory protein [Komagataeibacter xylinus NBRC 13693]|uniref:N-acylhomoserine lactone-dependent regulatory protein n=1 Tax=Komagataeibacter xylinus NBRC 13693 TaxID=1234668 RepID=A0A0D6QDM0_KOMXY|nr:LuxR family transcriptional regulator [Komagataeibacter xylinus]GAO00942.1 N-acylhomoserine lactone-dependent regulatory protein [Komagataeibacter xylinus NBRC 13693]